MQIGEKIKKLRTSKLMTQADLAGNEITRNMLSRIENGAAQPSLDTLKYLAKRLNVSAGFLLSESEDEQMYVKHNEIYGIKSAFLSGDYRICREMCLNSATQSDDEIRMILAECTLEIAIDEFLKGDLRTACEYFDMAIQECAKTVYNTERIISIASAYFRYMRRISSTLSSDCIDEHDVPIYSALSLDFCRYIGALLTLEGEEDLSGIENNIDKQSIYGLHIAALKYIRNEDFERAHTCLCRILFGEQEIPKPMMYFLFCDLEVCCKEIKDFKAAYEYSIDKIELLQRLLS